jgi:hypothetical protein
MYNVEALISPTTAMLAPVLFTTTKGKIDPLFLYVEYFRRVIVKGLTFTPWNKYRSINKHYFPSISQGAEFQP